MQKQDRFSSLEADYMTGKPSTLRGKIKSVWTEQDQVYGNASELRAFPSNSSPQLMKVEIKDVLPKPKSIDGSPKVEEIWTKQLN